jgi:hypothetical protein
LKHILFEIGIGIGIGIGIRSAPLYRHLPISLKKATNSLSFSPWEEKEGKVLR